MPSNPAQRPHPTAIGLGDANAILSVYAPHRPPQAPYDGLDQMHPFAAGELAQLVTATGNHWRKIFNLYAKLLHRLSPREPSWQDCREQRLLQAGSGTALLFSPPHSTPSESWRLVMGKAYAESCGLHLLADLQPLNGFDWSPSQRLILTPYFDYRALSNARLDNLYRLIDSQGGCQFPL
ncbi:DUF6942 family protein [Saccharospirillum mangrovi]|uniref:DUF6942 family protein n=1 Tax=Saccharospirillum mangrovi TaxID=2161747 RepID=UPI000D3B0DEA|nr:hypothetical protein [Saccharospirillum mangrovi]